MIQLDAFKSLVYQHCGLNLEGMAENRLTTALASLYAETGSVSPDALLARLASEPALFDQFVSLLTVNETYFYREPDALEWLADQYLPRQLAKRRTPLRLFSAGCSSGEEPYSLAMTLLERYGKRAHELFSITAGDVDQQVLHRARRGLYSGMSFRTLAPDLQQRYFSACEGGFKVNDDIRRWVDFCSFNCLAPSDQDLGGPFDAILFRNVSIYFDSDTRRAIQQRLAQLLMPEGVLIYGVTENLGNDVGVLELNESQGVFYFCHPTCQTDAQPTRPERSQESIQQHSTPPIAKPPIAKPPATLTSAENAACAADPPSFNRRIDKASELLDENAFNEAAALLDELLTEQPWSVDALLLSGLVARWQKKPEQAYQHFKRALYVAPECWPAHFYQAELYRNGDLDDAPDKRHRGYSAVVRLLSDSPKAAGGLQRIHSPIPPGDALFLATRYLDAASVSQGVG